MIHGDQDGRQIEIVEEPTSEWDEFVKSSSHGTFCHLASWRNVVGDLFGHECLYAVLRSTDGGIEGLLPLVRVRSHLFGDYLVSMPFLSYGGPIGNAEAQTSLATWAAELARDIGADLLELRTRHRVHSELRRSDRKITVILPLPPSKEALSGAIPSSRRRQIRRALNEGMEVRYGPNELDAFYEVFARNMRNLGTPVLPARFFEAVCEALSEWVRLAAVYWRGSPVAAGLGFAWRSEFELTWVSSLHEFRTKYPNMLLYSSLMEQSIDEGVRCFNFGRCTPGGSTHKFKRQWGGKDRPLPWLQASSAGVEAPPTPEKPIFRAATHVWRRLPVPVTKRLGPILSPYIP